MDKTIKEYFLKAVAEEPIEMIDRSLGWDKKSYIVKTYSESYVLKIPTEKKKIMSEIKARDLLSDIAGIPQVLYHDQDFLIEQCVEGKPLSEQQDEQKEVWVSVGKLLKKIHQVKGTNFGHLEDQSPYSNFQEFMQSWYPDNFEKLKETGLLTKEDISAANKYLAMKEKYLSIQTPVLIHGDLCDDHIFSKGKKLTGIIDFGDASFSSSAAEFASLLIFNQEELRWVFEGYGDISVDEVKFHTFLVLTWAIPEYQKRNESYLPDAIRLFRDIIGNQLDI